MRKALSTTSIDQIYNLNKGCSRKALIRSGEWLSLLVYSPEVFTFRRNGAFTSTNIQRQLQTDILFTFLIHFALCDLSSNLYWKQFSDVWWRSENLHSHLWQFWYFLWQWHYADTKSEGARLTKESSQEKYSNNKLDLRDQFSVFRMSWKCCHILRVVEVVGVVLTLFRWKMVILFEIIQLKLCKL